MRPHKLTISCWLLTLCWPIALSAGAPLPIDVVLREGAVIDGDAVVFRLEHPFVNDSGTVGFNGATRRGQTSDQFIWFDDGPIWFNSLGPGQFVVGEGSIGFGAEGQFAYRPVIDGLFSIWTDRGLLAQEGDPAPGIPNSELGFFSLIDMLPNGTIFWIGSYRDLTTPNGWAFYRTAGPGQPADLLLQTGDLIDGVPVASFVDLDVSDDGTQIAQLAFTESGSNATDVFAIFNGNLAAREGDPLLGTSGESWRQLQLARTNNAGNLLLTGKIDAPQDRDDVMVLDNQIILREGETLAGRALTSPVQIKGAALDDRARMLHVWLTDGTQTLFLTQDIADPAGTTAVLLTTGDRIDTNADGILDATITDFNLNFSSFRRLDLSNSDFVYVEVDLDGGNDDEAILRLDVSSLGGPTTNALEIPTLSWPAAVGLIALVAFAGLWTLRRRDRRPAI